MKKRYNNSFSTTNLSDCFPDKHLQMSLYEIFSIDLKPIEPASLFIICLLICYGSGSFLT